MPLTTLNDLVLQPRQWRGRNGAWCGDDYELEGPFRQVAPLLTSPEFPLEAGKLVTFTLAAEFAGACDYVFGVEPAGRGTPKLLHSRFFEETTGARRLSLAFRAAKTGNYRLSLRWSRRRPTGSRVAICRPELTVQTIGAGRISRVPLSDLSIAEAPADPFLPHWGGFRRYLHQRCRNSRRFNNLVAAIEMRLGCEEVVSLPQYMALCPTGQCNALCDFCSVTINRTGIIKKQLPFDQLDRLLAPMANTVQYYGLEGNGEPTLYARFPELVDRLSRGSRGVYLITNGSQLKPSDIPLMLALGSVNFSLNAATAETHRRVMKLKNFDEITAAIRAVSDQRGRPGAVSSPMPQIYVTCVVTNHNVHEIQDFVRLAERELRADVIMVRPLSELGNDIGAVEDLRDIVPYESDIADMADAVADYIADVQPHTAVIRLAPETFASVRPDPIGRVRMPAGFEGRLLAPRRGAWRALVPRAKLDWNVNNARFVLPATTGILFETDPIDIEPGRELLFEAKAVTSGGPATLAIVDEHGRTIGSARLSKTRDRAETISIKVVPGDTRTLAFRIVGHGRAAAFEIDFGRLRTPARYAGSAFHVPEARRWESCVSAAVVEWDGARVSVESAGGGGPYLLKSYGIPCGRDRTIEIPIYAEVRAGAISVGVLDGVGAVFLESMHFDKGSSPTSLIFDTGDNETVRLVVSAEPGRHVNATIYWPETDIGPGPAAPVPSSRLPGGTQWWDCGTGAVIDKDRDRIAVSWRGEGGPYLVKSNRFWCGANQRVRLPLAVRVHAGRIALGVLDASDAAWLETKIFEAGEYITEFDFECGPEGRVSAVIAAVDGAPAEIELALAKDGFGALAPAMPTLAMPTLATTVREPAEASRPPAFDQSPRSIPAAALALRAPLSIAAVPRRPFREWLAGTRAHRLWRAVRPARPYACQKPWTDLANFTVDGRLDVCCIATGASQTRYQLGNLNHHSFQQIWNGPAIREFRRTVNTAKPLPPCARCPMQRSFQGFWFDPRYTRQRIEDAIVGKIRPVYAGRAVGRLMARMAMCVFHGF